MRALVDMLGWEPREAKFALLQAGGPTADSPDAAADGEASGIGIAHRFRVLDARGLGVAFEGSPGPVSRVPGWKGRAFRPLDFTGLEREGGYYVEVLDPAGGVIARSPWFRIARDLRFSRLAPDILFYFKGQRCSGVWDARDAALPQPGSPGDATPAAGLDLHGGWFDASGDVSKYLSHLSYACYLNPQQTPFVVWALLESLARLERDGEGAAPRDVPLAKRFAEEALHGADFLLRMQGPEGFFYLTVFDGWSWDPALRRVCSYETQAGVLSERVKAGYREGGGLAVAALARASSLPGARGAMDADEYYDAAARGFGWLEANGASTLIDGEENVIDDYCALLAAVELSRAAAARGLDAAAYRAAAARRAAALGARLRTEGPVPGWLDSDGRGRPFYHPVEAGLPAIALLLYAESPEAREAGPDGEARKADALAAASALLGFELAAARSCENPFGLARQYARPVGGEARLSFFMPHRNESGYWWQGEDARLASLAAAAFRLRSCLGAGARPEAAPGAGELELFARDQIHWILGRNPFDISLFQGIGPENPVYDEGEENAPGGVANGITSGFHDEDDICFLPPEVAGDPEHRWRWSEQWLPHAAWLLLAVCSE
jgi:hypothetical protein